MESENEQDLSIVVAVASALGLGAMLALSQALRINKSEASFELSIWTGIAFLAGFDLTFAYLRFVFTHGNRAPRAFRRVGLAALIIAAAGALLYPFRLFQMDFLVDGFAGVGAALCFIAAGLTLIWRVVLVAQMQEDKQDAQQQHATVGSRLQASPDLSRFDKR